MSGEIPTTDPGVSEAADAAAKIIETPIKFGDVIPLESGSDAEKLAAHNLAQNQAEMARMTPPMPGGVEAGAPAPEATSATPNVVVGPPPTATVEQQAAALAEMPHFDAPAPKPEVPVEYPPVDENARKLTIIDPKQ